jgi:hypothetical protein
MPANQHGQVIHGFMTPEEKTRELIDAQPAASGWTVQTKNKINLTVACGVAVCELYFATVESELIWTTALNQ